MALLFTSTYPFKVTSSILSIAPSLTLISAVNVILLSCTKALSLTKNLKFPIEGAVIESDPSLFPPLIIRKIKAYLEGQNNSNQMEMDLDDKLQLQNWQQCNYL